MVAYWGHFRIVLGTLVGGALGFYVMHKAELQYQAKIRSEIAKLEQEERLREQNQSGSSGETLISD
ncbi:hypothetical protein BDL97_16G010300 [Sphagnum fallax]|jgi:hypothetical protein|uniref:ATP-dependent helicase/nuclease subunit A n=1 Tax=Sphagnum jensenii TaxID=128206 RepID=A0ABP0WDR7_9BRYO|nr:hypothetical protein BDL97_16G010300 [Sphagnum fallax]